MKSISDFDYFLPKELIAQKALKDRSSSMLLVAEDRIEHKRFRDILDYLHKGDVIVINETKVIKAKLRGKKSTGSPAEVIVERKKGELYECRVKSRGLRIGTIIEFENLNAEIVGKEGGTFILKFSKLPENTLKIKGELPQPDYIKRKVCDNEYQTVYAEKEGSFAAPTAGLHFTKEILENAERKGIKIAKICLHIGFGTFLPVIDEDYTKHRIHKEWFEISKDSAEKINNAKRVIAVGTTSLRALESADYEKGKLKACKRWADVFIYPEYKFRSKVEMLITNFHLPKSTLLLMVCAFAGRKKVLDAYKEAVERKYRFYSLGDAMLLFRENLHPQ